MGEGKRGLGIPCKATPYVTHSRTHLPAPDAAHIAAGSSYLLLLPCALASGSWAMISLLADFAAEIAGPDLWRDILKEGVSVCCDIAVPPGMLSLPLPFRPLTPPPDLPASPAAASLRGRLRSICERQRAGGVRKRAGAGAAAAGKEGELEQTSGAGRRMLRRLCVTWCSPKQRPACSPCHDAPCHVLLARVSSGG